MPRITRRAVCAFLGALVALAPLARSAAAQKVLEADVLVYGGTPAGIAAALAAAKSSKRVVLAEPCRWVGGMATNGLTHTDFRTFESLTGSFLDLSHQVQAYYVEKYGPDSPQATGNFRGTHAEPRVNRLVFERMLADAKVTVLTRHVLESVGGAAGGENPPRIDRVTFRRPQGEPLAVAAKVFIDGTYEGDLAARAGVTMRVGREAKSEHDEPLAPEQADEQVMGYNFRLTMTRDPANRVTPVAPPGYDRTEFARDLLPLLEAGKFDAVFVKNTGGIYKAHIPRLPNDKADINDVSHGLVRLSLPDLSKLWPNADAATRERLFAEHVGHNVGMLYFLQNDDAVPARYRDDARQWGWCKDEYPENGHLPEQLYVREARRMQGQHVYTERDVFPSPGDARSVLHTASVASGDYGPNSHGTGHDGPRIGGKHTGEHYKPVMPYQIPYGVLAPKAGECGNLLVPGALSSSHVGFTALRYEPIWMSLGQAAGHAAAMAIDGGGKPVQDVDVAQLQRRLHAEGSATIYVSDVPPGHPAFAAVQWWGTAGGLHGLNPPPEKPGQRGKQMVGQYYEAFPGHAAELDKPLDDATRDRWKTLAETLKIEAGDALKGAATRGAFITAAFGAYQK